MRKFRLDVIHGPAQGKTWESTSDRCAIGSVAGNDVVLDDPTVSRFHCELSVDARGVRVRDLGSRNGTRIDGVDVADAYLRTGSTLYVGRSTLRFELAFAVNPVPLSDRTELGPLVGTSTAMRAVFALLERAAGTDSTVLLEGESGCGKEAAAEALHAASLRRNKPLSVVDCGALPPTLLESELFGHERGAFTGATERRPGAFEAASGGTIFLDEIGELPLELQPKLLRALEQRAVRRLGGNAYQPVDVRVIAATNRDLRTEVNAGRFRADLYYRLAVVTIRIPPLRERPDDIPILVDRLLAQLGASAATDAHLRSEQFLVGLRRAAWPGNVRELRNYLERCAVLDAAQPLGTHAPEPEGHVPDARLPYDVSRRRALDHFERRYVTDLLALHRGIRTEAARAAGLARVYLWQLMRKHDIQ